MNSTITPRRSERTHGGRSAATAAGFAQLRAARLAKHKEKNESAGAKGQQQQKKTKVSVEKINKSAGAKAQQQKQQPPKSGPTQRKILAEVHREAGRLILTVKGVKLTEKTAEKGPGAPAASPSGRSDKTDKGPGAASTAPSATTEKDPGTAATTDKKHASGEDELPPLPRGVARCSVKGAAVKRKRVATASDNAPKKWAAAAKKAVRRLVKD